MGLFVSYKKDLQMLLTLSILYTDFISEKETYVTSFNKSFNIKLFIDILVEK